MRKIIVTGGAGFIGSNFIRHVLKVLGDVEVINADKLSYAGDATRLEDIESDERYRFLKCDICDSEAIEKVFSEGIDAVVHFAAESHVDRSIEYPTPFMETNVRGTLVLLEAARKHGIEKFVHISTDEVYGELGAEGTFSESSPLSPRSPYSASKASADHFAGAYHHTYGLPVCIARPSNNYGPYQFPEKLIPVAISRAMEDKPVPVYAKGENVREWLYVEDCAAGILAVLENGEAGEVYNIGSGEERRNIEVVRMVLESLGKPEGLIEFVADRPGHDFRYSLDTRKIKSDLGFEAGTGFAEGLEKTVRWYVDNEGWWRRLVAGR
jgi:dTDP-glucose 4,6-dehydratase